MLDQNKSPPGVVKPMMRVRNKIIVKAYNTRMKVELCFKKFKTFSKIKNLFIV